MAHVNTIFGQLLQLVDRHDFRRIENEGYRPVRKYRTLDRWEQFVVMMFAQITTRCGLRDIVNQFRFQSRRLYHLGARTVKRSTLADANSNRDAGFFEAVFHHQYKKCASVAPKKRFRFKNKLYSLDASVVDLCLSLFDWAMSMIALIEPRMIAVMKPVKSVKKAVSDSHSNQFFSLPF